MTQSQRIAAVFNAASSTQISAKDVDLILAVAKDAQSFNKPKHKTAGSAGADLICSTETIIQPGETKLVSTDSFVPAGLPNGIALLLMIRSSIALKKRLILSNGVGLIDADYRDEIKVMITNLNTEPVTLELGERIAQLVPIQYVNGVFECENLDRLGGFGSTGK